MNLAGNTCGDDVIFGIVGYLTPHLVRHLVIEVIRVDPLSDEPLKHLVT
jgi:hypothetical protein